ncbi:MAG: hypothetical protein A3F41_03605 [Coxiella sp. RIFCSPHIGHO2_12_FULL_44_14]|nr:MAG: hypothetical protein A3F41_03605 [Coxiella sp. RIFCSPHIGHO2_12_FULL_44_14]
MKHDTLTRAILIALTSAGIATTTPSIAHTPKEKNVEKCYGIVKTKMNDCGTPKHACASQAATDRDPNEWIYVLKGNCRRIAGGSLTPPDSSGS